MLNLLLIDKEFNPHLLSPELRRVYENYLALISLKSAWQILMPLKKKSQSVYVEQCCILAKKVKYVSFNKARLCFDVRVVYNGRRTFLGSSTDFDEACGFIKIFLTEKAKDASNIS